MIARQAIQRFFLRTSSTTQAHLLILFVIFAVYLLPYLAGFQTWPGAQTVSKLSVHMTAQDIYTFEVGNRPFRAFALHELLAGHFPLWLPTQMLGSPIVEQAEFQALNPLEWLNWLGTDLWWTLVLCAYLYVGALGILAICSRLGVSKNGAIGGAIAYTCAGQVPMFYTVPSWLIVTPLLPWIFFCISDCIAGAITRRGVFGLWVCVSLFLLSGQPQIIFCTAYFLLFYCAVLSSIGLARDRLARELLKRIVLTLSIICLAAIAASPQIYPFSRYILSGQAFSGHPFTLSGWHVSGVNLLNPLFPFSMGVGPYDNWTSDLSLRWAPSEDFPIGFYLSGGFLAATGLVGSLDPKQANRRTVSLCLTLVFAFGTIGLYGIPQWPVWKFEFINLARYSSPILSLLLSISIAIGLSSLLKRRYLVNAAGLGIIVGLCGVLLWIITLNFAWTKVSNTEVLIHIILLNIVSAFLCATMAYLAFSSKKSLEPLPLLMCFVGDVLFQVRYGFSTAPDALRLFPTLILFWGALAVNRGSRRGNAFVFASAICLIAGWCLHSTLYAVPGVNFPSPDQSAMRGHRLASSVIAYEPDKGARLGAITVSARGAIQSQSLQDLLFTDGFSPTKSPDGSSYTIRDFRGFANGTYDGGAKMSWGEYCTYRTRFNAIAAEYLVSDQHSTLVTIEGLKGCETGLQRVSTDDDRFIVYHDSHALPRAFIADACRVSTKDRALSAVEADISNLARRPILETTDTPPCSTSEPLEPQPLDVLDATPEKVYLRLGHHRSGLVVLNDQYFPSWHAYIDGKEAPVLRVNTIARGVLVSDDAQEVVFRFQSDLPWLYALSALSFGLALMLTLGIHRIRWSTMAFRQVRPTDIGMHRC